MSSIFSEFDENELKMCPLMNKLVGLAPILISTAC